MRRPGIEPGASDWKSEMLPVHQRRFSAATRFDPCYYLRVLYLKE